MVEHGVEESGAGEEHSHSRFVMLVVRSFNGEVQCTIDYTGHVLHARTDMDVYVSDPWHTASDVTLSFHRFPLCLCNSR